MSEIAEFTRHLGHYLPAPDVALVERAFEFSETAHRGQFRKSGEPYITHPLAVASSLSQWRIDAEGLAAALLHDVMEDTSVTRSQLEIKFGRPVAEMVDGVSKLDQIEFSTREEAQAESFRKMLLAMARDVRVILIKLADRLHNMRTLDAMAHAHRRRIARETLDIYAPIANRLGLNSLYRVLHGLYKPIPGKFKDYVAIPKANGYQSLHTTLFGPFGTPLEAQIRTHDMHRIAEAGVAAHWLYKQGGQLDLAEAQRETHRWLQSLLEIQSESRDSKEFLEHIKGDLFPEEIYVFTPKGKIMALSRGATAVDFAYG